jgi:hypothetical protein
MPTAAELARDKRNMNPHKAAIAAMYLYGAEYAAQRDGIMEFWDRLDGERQQTCRRLVDRLSEARKETNAEKPF